MISLVLCLAATLARAEHYPNISNIDQASRQLLNFRIEHPKPIGILTVSAGAPVDYRDRTTLNSDIFVNEHLFDHLLHHDQERIPERIVHAKGGGAWGYFEVTNDVSKYTKADVFNGIGKKTAVFSRFSTAVQNLGGADASREMKAIATKFYTKEGNLDFLNINFPVFFYRDSLHFTDFVHGFKRIPKTNLFSLNSRWDLVCNKPELIHSWFWLQSDYGFPRSYRHADYFPIHAYELHNKQGEKYYAKFNFRTEQGLQFLTNAQGAAITDLDAFNRDLYNNIEEKNYPIWRLDIDILSEKDLTRVNYNPFDVNRLWENGTFHTVTIGRLVVNRNTDNHFRDVEQSAYNPANLVPGIPGPVDHMFKGRRLAYRDTQNYRLSVNHNNIYVNRPLYAKNFNRDGVRPVGDNERDAPNYYPNSFNGAVPHVEASRPSEKIQVLDRNIVDLQPAADFYNTYVAGEDHRQRMTNNLIDSFVNVYPQIQERSIRLLCYVDKDLCRRIKVAVAAARLAGTIPSYSNAKNGTTAYDWY